ncbi:hypothetical protein N8388_09340 [Octadecabacter sp.]|nr:hypothetical protein [Octadecabacter sp.]
MLCPPWRLARSHLGWGWNEQRLQIFNSNDYSFNGGSMTLVSDGGVSLAWTRTGRGDWGATAAS